MKPFLILQHRVIDEAAENELDAFLQYGGLISSDVHRIRMEVNGIPEIELEDYSAIICGGGPSNVSDPEEHKSYAQKRFENDFQKLYKKIFQHDFPYLGACYGIGSLTKYKGGQVSSSNYTEEISSTTINLTEEANLDPLTQDITKEFRAFVGHKEACQELAPGATLLASSERCPIQMIRFKNNIYATQFHPELDTEGLSLRIRIYQDHVYFPPEQTELMIDAIKNEEVTIPEIILRRFVDKYRR
jgi:GMP synthase (glutamine-hydrolysing)